MSYKRPLGGAAARGKSGGDETESGMRSPVQTPPRTSETARIPASHDGLKRESVYFRSSSAAITPRTEEALRGLVGIINTNPESKLTITGHCALSGTEKGRETLSLLRAEKVHAFLTENGMSPSIMPDVRGMGSEQTVTEDPKRQYLNRRVEIVIEGGIERVSR
jgi:outer membrane protein OmpA-like peptidoglycan-associated protein